MEPQDKTHFADTYVAVMHSIWRAIMLALYNLLFTKKFYFFDLPITSTTDSLLS